MRKIILGATATALFFSASLALGDQRGPGPGIIIYHPLSSTTNPRPLPPMKNGSTTITGKELRERLGTSTDEHGIGREMSKLRSQNRFSLMVKRFEATLVREQEILNKINSRIVKTKADGKNTTDAEHFVSLAQNDLKNASSTLVSLKIFAENAITQDLGSTTGVSKPNMDGMKNTANSIKKLIEDAHKNLEKAIHSLIKLYKMNFGTTTPQTNEQ